MDLFGLARNEKKIQSLRLTLKPACFEINRLVRRSPPSFSDIWKMFRAEIISGMTNRYLGFITNAKPQKILKAM